MDMMLTSPGDMPLIRLAAQHDAHCFAHVARRDASQVQPLDSAADTRADLRTRVGTTVECPRA